MDRITQIQNFLKETPGDNFLKHALALEFIKVGNDGEAERCFMENLKENPAYIATYYHLGKLLERNRKTEEAIKIYFSGMEQAKSLDDHHAFSELRSVYEELVY